MPHRYRDNIPQLSWHSDHVEDSKRDERGIEMLVTTNRNWWNSLTQEPKEASSFPLPGAEDKIQGWIHNSRQTDNVSDHQRRYTLVTNFQEIVMKTLISSEYITTWNVNIILAKKQQHQHKGHKHNM